MTVIDISKHPKFTKANGLSTAHEKEHSPTFPEGDIPISLSEDLPWFDESQHTPKKGGHRGSSGHEAICARCIYSQVYGRPWYKKVLGFLIPGWKIKSRDYVCILYPNIAILDPVTGHQRYIPISGSGIASINVTEPFELCAYINLNGDCAKFVSVKE